MDLASKALKDASKLTPKRREDAFTIEPIWLEWLTQRGAGQAGWAGECQAGWAGEYLAALRANPRDDNAPLDLLVEMAQGPHHTAWWVNGIQLKLGLLGKVIGFSVLALQIGNIQSFDPNQTQDLLKSLTQGLGIALLTTMVGLVGNILLGLQLRRRDRYADALVADCQRTGLRDLTPPPEAPSATPPQGGAASRPAQPDPRRPLDGSAAAQAAWQTAAA